MDERLAVARSFGERVYGPFGTLPDSERIALTKDYLLMLIGEVDEVLRELDWKRHRPSGEKMNRNNFLEEMVDLYKFWLGVLALWGFTESEVDQMFWRKTEVVEQRFTQDTELRLTMKPIAVVDIDGVLANYPESFFKFMEQNGVMDVEITTGQELAHWKARYRDEGMEGAGVEPRAWARPFMEALHRTNHFVVALTSRPYSRYKRLFADTLFWFRRHRIPVDYIAFEEDKAAFVLRLLDQGKEVALFVDDDERYRSKVAALGVPTREDMS